MTFFQILRMASGCDHLLLLDTSGQVYSLGCAESGQLGRVSPLFEFDKLRHLILITSFSCRPISAKKVAAVVLTKYWQQQQSN